MSDTATASSTSSDPQPDTSSVSWALGVPPPVSANGASTYSYILRLGQQDQLLENNTTATSGGVTDKDTADWPTQGVLLYSADTLTMIAPTATTVSESNTGWSTDALSIVLNGSQVQTAEYTWGGNTIGYANERQVEMVLGLSTSITAGVETSIVLGSSTSVVSGAELYARTGFGVDMSSGMFIEIENADMSVVTPNSEVQMQEDFTQSASEQIVLGAGIPTGAGAAIAPLSKALQIILAAIELGVVADAVATDIKLNQSGKDLTADSDTARSTLEATFWANTSFAGAIVLVEIAAIVAGCVLANKARTLPGVSTLTLTGDGVELAKNTVGAITISTGNDPLLVAEAQAAGQAFMSASSAVSALTRLIGSAVPSPAQAAELITLNAAEDETAEALDTANDAVAANPICIIGMRADSVQMRAVSAITIDSTQSVIITAGATTLTLTSEGVNIEGPTITLNGQALALSGAQVDVVPS